MNEKELTSELKLFKAEIFAEIKAVRTDFSIFKTRIITAISVSGLFTPIIVGLILYIWTNDIRPIRQIPQPIAITSSNLALSNKGARHG